MINTIWFFMIIIGIFIAVGNGKLEVINKVIIENTSDAVTFAIGLTGIMATWLGLMKIAEKSGLIESIGKSFSKLMKYIFPDVPFSHPAITAMIMNMVANMFGAGNSATALGLKAMEELQKLNTKKDTATDAMIMFLVINMSSIQLIPLAVLKIRADANSVNPTEIIGPTLIATFISTLIGIFVCKIFERK
ncbi:nucleoside recognition domain-containing protein [Caminicella sporogenes]|uniref:nucleoside recognition domain-containing protein n=1 Tax=Caminicella sporogenes TaxID=166485 RepID=UPI0025425598|nr:nucleoside recognition domain-containing protein [Caminicella sporogenes]WIF95940.1 nucleoside recognition domain-containing protein [Caminicella sporogenes]